MFNIGGGEMVVLAILALLVFGPEGLPDILRTVARTVKAFKTAANDFQSEVNTALTLEQQKREVAERRRKRVTPPPSEEAVSPGPVEAAVATVAASQAPNQELEAESAPVLLAPEQPERLEAATEQVEDSSTEPSTNHEAASAEPASPAEPAEEPAEEEDDDGPGLPMTRPARVVVEEASEEENASEASGDAPAHDDDNPAGEKTVAARPGAETV